MLSKDAGRGEIGFSSPPAKPTKPCSRFLSRIFVITPDQTFRTHFEPQNPSIEKFYVVQKRRTGRTLRLWNLIMLGRVSGIPISTFM